MLAYACDPLGSGEHWLGWGWAEIASQVGNLTLYTRSEAKDALEPLCRATGIQLRCVDLPLSLRQASCRFGSAGSWWRKVAWAKAAAKAVARTKQEFHCVHQTTFHTFRVPFYAASLGLPSLWGPIGGGESNPRGFENFLGRAAHSEHRRDQLNRLCLRWPSVRNSLHRSDKIYVSNRTTLAFLPHFAHSNCEVVPANTVRDGEATAAPSGPREKHQGLRLIYAGNCVATRCLPLVFEAMKGVDNLHLTVAGEGPALAEWRQWAAISGASIAFPGKVDRDRLNSLYHEADALVFPALRDSGGSALLEAMSIGLPVVCLDWGGPGEVVDAESGIKIPVHDPDQVIRGLRDAFLRLRDDQELRDRLAGHGAARARTQFTWERKRKLLQRTYSALTGL